MRITVLGSGTSHGIPVIGCTCPVCTGSDTRDKRYRSSIMVEEGSGRIVIDTGYEFRLQMLREKVSGLDAVLYTHSHADHVSGIDDLRVFSRDRNLPIYGNAETMQFIEEHYAYAFDKDGFPGNPHLVPNVLAPLEEVSIAGINVIPIPLEHGRVKKMPVYGYRFSSFAYLTDCTFIPPASFEALKGVRTIMIGALRKAAHGAHFSFGEAYAAAKKAGAEKIYFTHINHETGCEEINSLYEDAESAYDTMVLEV